MRKSTATKAIALAAATLLIAGCSSSDTEPSTSPTPTGEASEPAGEASADLGLDPEVIRIGIKFDQPGLGLKVGGDYEGFDVDVAKYVAAELGYSPDQVEFVESISAQRETLIQNGSVDLVFATYSITDARKEKISFGGPYFIAGQDFLVSADDDSITGPDGMDGKILCSVEGSISAERVRDEHSESVQLYPAQTYSECIELLSSGAVDAVSTDDIILAGFAAQPQYEGKFKVVGNPFSVEKYGIGMELGNAPLCEAVNAAVTKMYDDGAWAAALASNTPENYVANEELNPPVFEGCDF